MATLTINPPFRADHIGSLKRPAELLKLRADVDAGKATQAELTQLEDKVIKEQAEQLREIGIKSVTDGEFRRHMFFDGFFDNLDGMVALDDAPREIFKMYVPDVQAFFSSDDHKKAATMICNGKLKRSKPMYRSQFEYIATLVPKDEVKNIKMTLCAPEWFHLRHGEHAYDHKIYSNDAAYFADIALAYQAELQDLYSIGCRNVQFDDPLLAYFCSEAMLSGMKEVGVDSAALLDAYIGLYNDCLKGRPKDMTVGVHLCRGNFIHGRHFSEGGYEHISSKLFKELDADTYYLEYDTARAGGFEPLSDLPPHKSVVLGLVSSKLAELEDEQELINKINQAAEFVAKGSGESKEKALNRLCLSPQCGFASHSEGNDVTREDVKKKLQLVVKTAKAVWSDA